MLPETQCKKHSLNILETNSASFLYRTRIVVVDRVAGLLLCRSNIARDPVRVGSHSTVDSRKPGRTADAPRHNTNKNKRPVSRLHCQRSTRITLARVSLCVSSVICGTNHVAVDRLEASKALLTVSAARDVHCDILQRVWNT
jgi:hypothetical protein